MRSSTKNVYFYIDRSANIKPRNASIISISKHSYSVTV